MRYLDLHKSAAEPVLADTPCGQLAIWAGSAAAAVELRVAAQTLPKHLSAPVHLCGAAGYHLHLGNSHAALLVQVQAPSALPKPPPVLQLELVRQPLALPVLATTISAAVVRPDTYAEPRIPGADALEVAATPG